MVFKYKDYSIKLGKYSYDLYTGEKLTDKNCLGYYSSMKMLLDKLVRMELVENHSTATFEEFTAIFQRKADELLEALSKDRQCA